MKFKNVHSKTQNDRTRAAASSIAHQFVFAESRAGRVPLGVEEDPEPLVGHRLVHLVVHLARDHLLHQRGDLAPQSLQHVQVGGQVLRGQVVHQGEVQPLQGRDSVRILLIIIQAWCMKSHFHFEAPL